MKRKRNWSTPILILGCIIGLSLLLYPSFSNYWNGISTTQSIAKYTDQVTGMDEADYRAAWKKAQEYNRDLASRGGTYSISGDMKQRYNACLNIAGDGMMGYVEIPKIKVLLPIYHGTSDLVLQTAVGHLDWSSLPVGGESTHCALSGHRGLLSAKLFTDLDALREGDYFTLNILNETLTYEVDQIRIVKPENLTDLSIEEGKDYCTLVTCTPYGINTHRMLVRGHRVENILGPVQVVSEAVIVEPLIVAPILAAIPLFALFLMVMLKKPESKSEQEKQEKRKRAEALLQQVIEWKEENDQKR
ncbi:MAG: class C sortase [Clostridiales bacterium]|nr:class C sortase [Candidatus Cacconaster stercorequi]